MSIDHIWGLGNQGQWLDEDEQEFTQRIHNSQDSIEIKGDGPAPEAKRGSYAKHWMFTSYRDEEPTFPASAVYAVWQRESCPTSGRLHWQGYVEFTSKKRIKSVQDAIGDPKAHCELRKGTADQATAYCSKEETRVPGTQPTVHGTRGEETGSQVQLVGKRIREGASYSDICDEQPTAIMRYDKGIRALIADRDGRRPLTYRALRVVILTGSPGCGKTRWAFERANDKYEGHAHFKPYAEGQASWWDGYNGQRLLIIDDFEGQAPMQELLTLLGGYGHNQQWPIKGSFIRLDNLEEVIITSNTQPDKWYPRLPPVKTQALYRRFTKVMDVFETISYTREVHEQ